MGCIQLSILDQNYTPLKVVQDEVPKLRISHRSKLPKNKDDAGLYRFGFNGMEKDDEVKGAGNQYHATYRAFDTRLGRFFATDPFKQYHSDYVFAGDDPINMIDPSGGFAGRAKARQFAKSKGLSRKDYTLETNRKAGTTDINWTKVEGGEGGKGDEIMSMPDVEFGSKTFEGPRVRDYANAGFEVFRGASDAYMSNQTLEAVKPRQHATNDFFLAGQMLGDVATLVQSVFEIGIGYGVGTGGGTALSLASGGTLVIPGAAMATGGATLGTHGALSGGSALHGLAHGVLHFAKLDGQGNGPGKIMKKGLNQVKQGKVQSHDVYQGREHSEWAGAKEYRVPGAPNDEWRILELIKTNGEKVYGWTKRHYKEIMEF